MSASETTLPARLPPAGGDGIFLAAEPALALVGTDAGLLVVFLARHMEDPVAASAEIKVWPDVHYEHEQLIPHAGNLTSVNTAMHEYLGLLWAFFRGQLGSAPWEAVEDSESTSEPEPEPKSESPPKSEQEEDSLVDDRAFFVRN